jgi:hypothetical protein
MNVEIGTEAAQFPEKEYINAIFIAVYTRDLNKSNRRKIFVGYRGKFTHWRRNLTEDLQQCSTASSDKQIEMG